MTGSVIPLGRGEVMWESQPSISKCHIKNPSRCPCHSLIMCKKVAKKSTHAFNRAWTEFKNQYGMIWDELLKAEVNSLMEFHSFIPIPP